MGYTKAMLLVSGGLDEDRTFHDDDDWTQFDDSPCAAANALVSLFDLGL